MQLGELLLEWAVSLIALAVMLHLLQYAPNEMRGLKGLLVSKERRVPFPGA